MISSLLFLTLVYVLIAIRMSCTDNGDFVDVLLEPINYIKGVLKALRGKQGNDG